MKERVGFVLVGALAVGHYAVEPSAALATYDCDLLLWPTPANLARALRALVRKGWNLEAGGEPLGPVDAEFAASLIAHGALVRGRIAGGMGIDLMLEAPPFPYSRWRASARTFMAGGAKIRVGALAMLLEAKRRANRPKDRAFLAQWKALNPPKKKRRSG